MKSSKDNTPHHRRSHPSPANFSLNPISEETKDLTSASGSPKTKHNGDVTSTNHCSGSPGVDDVTSPLVGNDVIHHDDVIHHVDSASDVTGDVHMTSSADQPLIFCNENYSGPEVPSSESKFKMKKSESFPDKNTKDFRPQEKLKQLSLKGTSSKANGSGYVCWRNDSSGVNGIEEIDLKVLQQESKDSGVFSDYINNSITT